MTAATQAPAPATTFPTHDSLCESCGYSLRGLAGSERCPECGTPLAESDPARRVGLPWQNGMSVGSWLKTTWMMVVAPRRAFRQMRIERGTSAYQRTLLYVWFCAVGNGLLWAILTAFTLLSLGHRSWPPQDTPTGEFIAGVVMLWMAWSTVSFVLVASLNKIESVGVVWVSRRRGLRVPSHSASLLTAYSSIGWLPSGLIMAVLTLQYIDVLPSNWDPFRGDIFDLFIFIAIFAISILWFETLVWLGVRQVRYANFSESTGADLTQ